MLHMATPRIPGTDPDTVELPCGTDVAVTDFDLGMREYPCDCGENHAVVMDIHPPTRFFPSEVVEVLTTVIEPAEGGEFGTHHLLGLVLEEFPDQVVDANVAENGQIGCQYLWVTDFDSRRLHQIIVELVIELMDHAMTHSEDDQARSDFTTALDSFEVETFVDRYREERDLDSVY